MELFCLSEKHHIHVQDLLYGYLLLILLICCHLICNGVFVGALKGTYVCNLLQERK